MLATALADPDPVLIFEQIALYGVSGELPDDTGTVDLDTAAIRRAGTDVTLVGYGGSVATALATAEELAAHGVSSEVIDLRTLRPLDEETVLESVGRTHRLVLVDNAWRSGGPAAEVAARVAERALYELDAPIERVAGAEVPIPYPQHLQDAALPAVADVVAAALRAVG